MDMIERQSSLDRLQELAIQARHGMGHIVALIGAAGVGKSTLARAVANSANSNSRVFWGACEDFATAEPLGAVSDLARQLSWDIQGAVERRGRLAAFSEGFGLFNDKTKTNILLIEDIHWADDATLDFIRYLGRRIHASNILLIITARNDDAIARLRLRQAVADIPPDNIVRMDVPPLSEDGVISIAQAHGLDGQALYRITSGNAFFVTELLRDKSSDLPVSIRDAILTRAQRLLHAGRTALEVVSIFPAGIDLPTMRSFEGDDALAALDQGMEDGLLHFTDGHYAFQHEIARRVIEQALSISRRRELNALALKALRATEDIPIAQLVHHAREANDIMALRELAPLAAEQASGVSAHREAVRHYEVALAHAHTFHPLRCAELYERYAFECHLIGQMARAILAQKNALAIHVASGDRLREGDCLRWLSRLSYLDGNRIDADRFGHEALAILKPLGAGPELAMAYSNQSQLAMLASDADAASTFGHKAIELSESTALDRPDILCHALNNVGSAIHWQDPVGGRFYLDRSLEIALAHDFQEHAARTFTNRAWLELHQFPNNHAEAYLVEGIAYCVERDLDTWRDYMRGYLAELLVQRGQWDEAEQVARSVIDSETASGLARYPAVIALARVKTRRRKDVTDLMAEATRFLDAGMELQRFVPFVTLLAERAWLGLEDKAEATALLEKARSLAPNVVDVIDVLKWQYLIGESVDRSEIAGLPQPLLLMVDGEWRAAADIWQSADAPYDCALALLSGDEDAQYRALGMFEAIGADAVAEHVRRLIRGRSGRVAPRGPRASTKANPAGLTRRQMDVLKLIELGKSNHEIGDALFVSAKTIDHHISAILAKLNAKSRGQAAAIARQAGLL